MVFFWIFTRVSASILAFVKCIQFLVLTNSVIRCRVLFEGNNPLNFEEMRFPLTRDIKLDELLLIYSDVTAKIDDFRNTRFVVVI